MLLYFVEILRDSAWLLVLSTLAAAAAPRFLLVGTRVLCIVLILLPFIILLSGSRTLAMADPTLLMSRGGLAMSLVALILLEQVYRNSTEAARSAIKYLTIGVGAMFAFDLFLYSQTELLRGISADAWNARGVVNAIAVPLIALAVRSNPDWSTVIFVSRQVVFYTTTFMAIGIYLLVMAIGGFYVREVGGSWGDVGQIIFLAGALVVLLNLVASASLRRRAQVFISKHFYRNKYDYRIEWLRFIKTLSSGEEGDVRRAAVHAISQIFQSPGGLLFVLDETERSFVPYAAWPMHPDALPGVGRLAASDDMASFLDRTHWIIDTVEYRRAPDVYGNIRLPE
jgi:putative PEP-CTERM system histidine kinase